MSDDAPAFDRIVDPLDTQWPDGRNHQCRITDKQVLVDGVPIPGYIAEDGVEIKPGKKHPGELNTVTVTLVVGDIVVERSASDKVKRSA